MEINTRYMLITFENTPLGINLSAWICSVEFYQSEISRYPYGYNYIGEFCNWIMHCNHELTPKLVTGLGESVDVDCHRTEMRHLNRKIANRS